MDVPASCVQSNEQPLYRQVYERFVQGIQQNVLMPGQRVPSIRALASDLQLSRNTIEMAYGLLIEEGYLEARGPAGTIVSKRVANIHIQESTLSSTPKSVSHSLFETAADFFPPFPYQLGLPGLDLFPYKLWATLNTRQLRLQKRFLAYPQSAGYQPLREVIASYLRVSRGLNCIAEQVFITAGYRAALNLIGHTLMRPRDQVWIEDPCFLILPSNSGHTTK